MVMNASKLYFMSMVLQSCIGSYAKLLPSVTMIETSSHFQVIAHIFEQLLNNSHISIITNGDEVLDTKLVEEISRNWQLSIHNIAAEKQKLESLVSIRSSEVIVFICRDIQLLKYVIEETEAPFYWNYESKFIVILTTYEVTLHTEMKSVFDITWTAKLLDVTLILQRNCREESRTNNYSSDNCLILAMYNPFSETITVTFVDKSAKYPSSRYLSKNSLYLLQNMNGHLLKVAVGRNIMPFVKIESNKEGNVTTYHGVYGKIFECLIHNMNFTPSIKLVPTATNSGIRNSNGSWTNLLGDLQEERAEVALRSVSYELDRFLEFKYAYPLIISDFFIIVQKAKQIPKWMCTALPFLAETWLLIFIVLFSMHFCLLFVKVIQKRATKTTDIFFTLFAVLLLVSTREPNTRHEKFLFMLFVYFSLIAASLYQGLILSYLTLPRYFRQIKKFEDVLHASITVCANEPLINVFKESPNPYLKSLYINSRIDPNVSKTLLEVAEYGSIASCSIAEQLEYLIRTLFPCGNSDTKYYRIEKSIRRYMSSFCLSRNTPYLSRINSLIMRAIEAGLLNHWTEDIMTEPKGKVCSDFYKSSSKASLTLRDVQSCFWVFQCGCMLGLCAFILEFCLWRRKHRSTLVTK